MRSRFLGGLAALALALATLAPSALAQPRHHHHERGDNRKLNHGEAWAHDLPPDWFDITNQTVGAAAYPEAVSASRAWALSWVAGARAVGGSENRTFATAA